MKNYSIFIIGWILMFAGWTMFFIESYSKHTLIPVFIFLGAVICFGINLVQQLKDN